MFAAKITAEQPVRQNQRLNGASQKNHKVYILQYSPSRSKSNSKGKQITNPNPKRTPPQHPPHSQPQHHTQPALPSKQNDSPSHLRNIDKLFDIIKRSRRGLVLQKQQTGCQKLIRIITTILQKKSSFNECQLTYKYYAFEALKQNYLTSSSTNYQLFIKSKYDKNYNESPPYTTTYQNNQNQPVLQRIYEQDNEIRDSNDYQTPKLSENSNYTQKLSRRQISPINELQSHMSPVQSQKSQHLTPNGNRDEIMISKDNNIRTYETLPDSERGDHQPINNNNKVVVGNSNIDKVVVNEQVSTKTQLLIKPWTKITIGNNNNNSNQTNNYSNQIKKQQAQTSRTIQLKKQLINQPNVVKKQPQNTNTPSKQSDHHQNNDSSSNHYQSNYNYKTNIHRATSHQPHKIPSSSQLYSASVRQLTGDSAKPPQSSQTAKESSIKYQSSVQQLTNIKTIDNANISNTINTNANAIESTTYLKQEKPWVNENCHQIIKRNIFNTLSNIMVDSNVLQTISQSNTSKKQFFVFNNNPPEAYIRPLIDLEPISIKPTSPIANLTNLTNPLTNFTQTTNSPPIINSSKPTSPKPISSFKQTSPRSKQYIFPYAIAEEISRENSKYIDNQVQHCYDDKMLDNNVGVNMNDEDKKKMCLRDVVTSYKDVVRQRQIKRQRQNNQVGTESSMKGKKNSSKVINSKQIAQMMLFGNAQSQHHHQNEQQIQPIDTILILDQSQHHHKPDIHQPINYHQIKSHPSQQSNQPQSTSSHQYLNNNLIINPHQLIPTPSKPKVTKQEAKLNKKKQSTQQQLLRKRCNSMPKITFTYYPSLQKYQQAVNLLKKITPPKLKTTIRKQANSSKDTLKNDGLVKLDLKNPGIRSSLKMLYQNYKRQEETQATYNYSSSNQTKTNKIEPQNHNTLSKKSSYYRSPVKQLKTTTQPLMKQPNLQQLQPNHNRPIQMKSLHQQYKHPSIHHQPLPPPPLQSINNQYYTNMNHMNHMRTIQHKVGLPTNKDRIMNRQLMNLHDDANNKVEYVNVQNKQRHAMMMNNRVLRSHSANGKLVFGRFAL